MLVGLCPRVVLSPSSQMHLFPRLVQGLCLLQAGAVCHFWPRETEMPDDSINVLAAVRDLAPSISARAAEIESGRRLPVDLLDQLIAAGCFRMLTPRSHGGLEVDLPLSMEILETIAAADGATGWTVMIGSESPMLLALLPRHRFDQIYAEGPDVIIGGGFAPRGQAAVIASTGDGRLQADANIRDGSSAIVLSPKRGKLVQVCCQAGRRFARCCFG